MNGHPIAGRRIGFDEIARRMGGALEAGVCTPRKRCPSAAGGWVSRRAQPILQAPQLAGKHGIQTKSCHRDARALPAARLARSVADRRPQGYPFCLPLLRDDFELNFDRAITIIVGENGTGKSTLLEGIAVLAGYDEAGGGKGYRPVDHSDALEKMGGAGAGGRRADGTLQGHAGVLCRSLGVCGSGDGGVRG
jgi:hypothetical protein